MFASASKGYGSAVTLLLLLSAAAVLGAQEVRLEERSPALEARPSLRVGALSADLRLDGVLDEKAWAETEAIEGLTMVEPRQGLPPSFATIVKVLADARHVVIGIACKDPEPDRIVSHSVERDAFLEGEDRVRIVIDTFRDGRTGYVFAVNPSGARRDGLVAFRGEGENRNWDGVWEAKTSRDGEGWNVEIRIPITTLSFPDGLREWHFNVERRIQRLLEVDRWASPQQDFKLTQTSRAGLLVDLPEFDFGQGMSVRPTSVARYGKTAPGKAGDFDLEPSLDLTQRLGPNLLASFTVNTDFSETEVDERRTNLTRFPLFFPEKRTFFLEGSDVFDFGLGLSEDVIPFHSRTIGLVNGEPVPLLVGGKLSGRIGETSLGAYGVRMEEEEGLSPETSLGVVRLRQNVLEESSLGLIATAGDPLGRDRSWMAGGDFVYQTSRFLGDKNFLAGVWGLGMDREDLDGASRSAFGAKIDYPNDVLDMAFTVKRIGEDFQPSLGFVPRPGIYRYDLNFDYTLRPENGWVRRMSHEFRPMLVTDLEGHWESYRVFTAPLNWDFESGEEFEFNVIWQGEDIPADFVIAGDVVVPRGTYHWVRFQVQTETAAKRPLSARARASAGDFYDGSLLSLEAWATWHVLPLVTIEGGGERNVGRLDDGDFVEDVYAARVRVHFSPDVSLSSLIQYDTESRLLGTNTRLHWAITPFSDLFLVYNYNWLEEGGDLAPESYEGVLKVQYTLRF